MPIAVRRALIAHARREVPRECCGFLVGHAGSVVAAVACANVARGTTHYRIAPREHIDLRRVLRDFRPPLTIVGVYHSHPAGPARPSATDLAEAHYRQWIQVIVGLTGARAQVRAYMFSREHAVRLRLVRDTGRRLSSPR
jgi:proteasome lid subunit RPN8/RPN11